MNAVFRQFAGDNVCSSNADYCRILTAPIPVTVAFFAGCSVAGTCCGQLLYVFVISVGVVTSGASAIQQF